MSKRPDKSQASEHDETDWYLKINDELIYGPVSLNAVYEWTTEGRVAAGNQISTDKQNWMRVETVPSLKMNWTVELNNGEHYGPFNLLAAPHLLRRRIIAPDSILCNKNTGKQISALSLLKQKEHIDAETEESLPSAMPRAGMEDTPFDQSAPPLSPEPPPQAKESTQIGTPAESLETKMPAGMGRDDRVSQLFSELSQEILSRSQSLPLAQEQLRQRKLEFQNLMEESRQRTERLRKRLDKSK